MQKRKRARIEGAFYPWTAAMGNSQAMKALYKNPYAVLVLTMFVAKYSLPNEGKNLALTYKEVSRYMSSATFQTAKLWLMAFGFIFCTRFGRLERNASIYELSSKWKYLSGKPEKLVRIARLLSVRTKASRLSVSKIRNRKDYSGRVRKKMFVRKLERAMLEQ